MWGAVISLFGGIFKDYQKERIVKQESKSRINEAKVLGTIKRIEAGDNHAMSMDLTERKNAGWMDDFSFIVFMTPAILCFYPPMVPHVRTGFEVLNTMPEWYQYGLGGMLIAVWGYRRLLMPIVQKLIEKRIGI
tara:strand:+ start:788 stop:1189 length:402 start_codon:yes stop_codon:yes gene_type:complete